MTARHIAVAANLATETASCQGRPRLTQHVSAERMGYE